MRRSLVALDLCLAAAFVAGIVTALLTSTVLAAGFGLVAVKRALFVVGLCLFGLAALLLRAGLEPDAFHGDGQTGTSVAARDTSRLRAAFETLLPDAWIVPRPARVSDPAKLTLAGVLILLVSYVMEAGFGIGV